MRRTVRTMFGELTVRAIKNGRYKGSVACFDFQTAQDQNSRTPREQGGRGNGACGTPFFFFFFFLIRAALERIFATSVVWVCENWESDETVPRIKGNERNRKGVMVLHLLSVIAGSFYSIFVLE